MSTFDKIDNFLTTKKSSEVYLIFFLAFCVVAFIIYSYVFPVTEKMLQSSQKSFKAMQSKLNQERAYLNSVTRNGDERFYIKQMQKDLKTKEQRFDDIVYVNSYVDTKLKELSYLLFNDRNWSLFLDSITRVAKENDVTINLIQNTFNEPSLQKIEQVLNVKVELDGDFKNIMKFINTLEESELVVDIYNLKLESQDLITGYIDIGVWGMKY